MLADEFAQTISERRSVGPKQQTHNAPSDDVFVRAARAARSAPSHNPFFPCRFVKVVSREKLADVFESALTNFLNVLWAEGVAAKTLTSREIKDPQGLFDPKTERLLGFILCGLPQEPMQPRDPEPSILSEW